ncbi:DNA helicase PIF1, ATP-dependent [Tanacetum coccineum]
MMVHSLRLIEFAVSKKTKHKDIALHPTDKFKLTRDDERIFKIGLPKFDVVKKSEPSQKAPWFLDQLEVDVTGTIVVMIGRIWDVNAIIGRYMSTDFVVSDSKGNMIHCSAKSNVAHNFLRIGSERDNTVRKVSVDFRLVDLNQIEVTNSKYLIDVARGYSLRVTLRGGLGDVLVEWKTNHVSMCAVVLTRMFVKDYNNKLYLSSSSSTVICDDDDIPCIQELKADSRKGATRQLRKWFCEACNRHIDYPVFRYRLEVVVADDTASIVVVMFNDTTMELIKCSAELLMVGDDEGAEADPDSNLPTAIRNLVGTTHVLEIKSHTYYKYGSFESFTCWKINPSDLVDDATSSSIPTLTADEASPSFKRLAKNPTVKTPSKPNEEKKKRGKLELEDSDGDEACPTLDNKKRKRYIADDFETE